MSKVTLTLHSVLRIFLVLMISVQALQAWDVYETSNSSRATDLTIKMELTGMKSYPSSFLRILKFKNRKNFVKSMWIDFQKQSGAVYEGKPYYGDISILEEMAEPNKRTYWDRMYLYNNGDLRTLNIKWMEIWITYGNHAAHANGDWDPEILIGYETNKTLKAGYSTLTLSNTAGRNRYIAKKFLYGKTSLLSNYPYALRRIIYDLGKSGSSDSTDSSSSVNEKYGLTGPALCSETVSWYYYETGVKVVDQWHSPGTVYNFRDITSNKTMLTQFHRANLRYDYSPSTGKWHFMHKSGALNMGVTYKPKPGDMLDRMSLKWNAKARKWVTNYEHAMMILKWDDRAKVAYVIDGPFPVAVRKVPVGQLTSSGAKKFAIGKLPTN